MQATAVIFVLCVIALTNAQYMSPYQSFGMGSSMGGPMGSPMWRSPGWMQTSHLSSMTYPSWRSHPLFRMAAATDKNVGVTVPQGMINIPSVPSNQEVLTHMALANPNPKPVYDTISDFLYDPQKARQAILTPVYLQGMNVMRANIPDDCGPQDSARWERELADWVY